MLTQAFFYNAIFFTYPLVLMRFYDVPAEKRGFTCSRLPLAMCSVRSSSDIFSTQSVASP